MSVISYKESTIPDNCQDVANIPKDLARPKKVLEEEEYLDRMAKIIRRDYFSHLEFPESSGTSFVGDSCRSSKQSFDGATPGTGQTYSSVTSSVRSRKVATSMNLNDFLDKYTSEDNDYFEKQQRKELRRHRQKYPWLYDDQREHNKEVNKQLQLPSKQDQTPSKQTRTSIKAIDWPYNSKNSLFFPKSSPEDLKRSKVVINHHSSRYINDPIFKVPLQPKSNDRPKSFMRFSDKVGVDGNLINRPETPINDFSLAPSPSPDVLRFSSSSSSSVSKTEPTKYYLLTESPRDELLHRVYNERVSKMIRTPRTGEHGQSSSRRTPSERKDFPSFSFSPDRNKTPVSLKRNKR